MRAVRKVIDIGLALVGVAMILAAVVFVRDKLSIQLALVGAGMVVLELGVWKAAHRVLPTGRRYLALRDESNEFLHLVRRLNTAALAVKQDNSRANAQAFEEVQNAMQRSVERMAAVAGKTDTELTAGDARTDTMQLPADTGSGSG